MTTDDQDPPKTARVLLVVDQPVLARVIQLALTHGPYMTQVAATITEADAALGTWQPHLAIVDMDLVNGAFLERVGTEESTDRATTGDRPHAAGRSGHQAGGVRAGGR